MIIFIPPPRDKTPEELEDERILKRCLLFIFMAMIGWFSAELALEQNGGDKLPHALRFTLLTSAALISGWAFLKYLTALKNIFLLSLGSYALYMVATGLWKAASI